MTVCVSASLVLVFDFLISFYGLGSFSGQDSKKNRAIFYLLVLIFSTKICALGYVLVVTFREILGGSQAGVQAGTGIFIGAEILYMLVCAFSAGKNAQKEEPTEDVKPTFAQIRAVWFAAAVCVFRGILDIQMSIADVLQFFNQLNVGWNTSTTQPWISYIPTKLGNMAQTVADSWWWIPVLIFPIVVNLAFDDEENFISKHIKINRLLDLIYQEEKNPSKRYNKYAFWFKLIDNVVNFVSNFCSMIFLAAMTTINQVFPPCILICIASFFIIFQLRLNKFFAYRWKILKGYFYMTMRNVNFYDVLFRILIFGVLLIVFATATITNLTFWFLLQFQFPFHFFACIFGINNHRQHKRKMVETLSNKVDFGISMFSLSFAFMIPFVIYASNRNTMALSLITGGSLLVFTIGSQIGEFYLTQHIRNLKFDQCEPEEQRKLSVQSQVSSILLTDCIDSKNVIQQAELLAATSVLSGQSEPNKAPTLYTKNSKSMKRLNSLTTAQKRANRDKRIAADFADLNLELVILDYEFDDKPEQYSGFLQNLIMNSYSFIPYIGVLLNLLANYMNAPGLVQEGIRAPKVAYFINFIQFGGFMIFAYLLLQNQLSNAYYVLIALIVLMVLDALEEGQSLLTEHTRYEIRFPWRSRAKKREKKIE